MKNYFCSGFCHRFSVVVLVCATLGMFVFSSSASVNIPEAIAFRIMQNGDNIGRHTVKFKRIKDDLHVDIAIDIEVRILFIPVFSYSHRNHEVWQGGRLISLKSETDDNGEKQWVKANATDRALEVDSSSGSFEAPLGTFPTSYWSPQTISKSVLLDTQHGKLLNVSVSPAVDDFLVTPLGEISTKRYDVSGDLRLSLWYSKAGGWVKTAFQVYGVDVEYFFDPKLLQIENRKIN